MDVLTVIAGSILAALVVRSLVRFYREQETLSRYEILRKQLEEPPAEDAGA